jgi:RNA polymerase sigma-70 factor, ECF subfamily
MTLKKSMSHLSLVTPELPSTLSDEALVTQVIGGNMAAFETLMRRHNRRVYRTARSILKSDHEAEDAMQEAYVSAFAHLKEYSGRSKFSTWLLRITVYECLGRLRRGKRFTSLEEADCEDTLMATTRSPELAARDVEMRQLLEAAVDALPVSFRTVFMMRAVEEMSVEETADTLDIPPETVRTRLHRANKMLRDSLSDALESAAPRAFDFHLSRCALVVAAVLAKTRST